MAWRRIGLLISCALEQRLRPISSGKLQELIWVVPLVSRPVTRKMFPFDDVIMHKIVKWPTVKESGAIGTIRSHEKRLLNSIRLSRLPMASRVMLVTLLDCSFIKASAFSCHRVKRSITFVQMVMDFHDHGRCWWGFTFWMGRLYWYPWASVRR